MKKSEKEAKETCPECCREISHTPENDDYVYYFCSTECWLKWSENSREEDEKKIYVDNKLANLL
jgi:endogenous inhibitor of DNA gyrase (YacG/DUF329 family)